MIPSPFVAIIDYATGNAGALLALFKRLRIHACLTREPAVIQKASKIILPGVGAFDHAMRSLAQHNLIPVLRERVLTQKTPLLGICLGAQILGHTSEEGSCPGLGWLDMETKKFSTHDVRVPHIGWQEIQPKKASALLEQMAPDARFYFVHSYYMACNNPVDILAQGVYGHDFVCAVSRDNIHGVQFHPEKSHRFGEVLLKNFANA